MVKDNTHPKIVNFSLDILSPYLNKGYRFVENNEDNKEISYALNGDEQHFSRDDVKGNAIPVVPMKNGYWIGCSYSFFKQKYNKKILKQLCIHVFDDKMPLFRADWACEDIKESKNHAQPHWHFDTEATITKRPKRIASLRKFQDFNDDEKDEESTLVVDLGRFHFFMNWDMDKQKEVSAPYLDFRDEQVLKNWMTKAMQYIDAELRAIVNR